MTTQKTLKRRVRARAAKTGESYTAARAQVLRRTAAGGADPAAEDAGELVDTKRLAGVSEEAMRRGSGKPLGEWLGILDAWGARDRTHAEIARWLREDRGVDGWWAQSVTVAYERARGMRAVHEQRTGFSVSATRTVSATPERVLAMFTDESARGGWLGDAPMRRRRTTATNVARFDWDEPPSRVVVGLTPRADGRTQVAVAHEKLPDAEAGERLKAMWRERLGVLRGMLEGG